MELQANEVYRAMLDQCHFNIGAGESSLRGRRLVAFVDFALSDVSRDTATAVRRAIDTTEMESWDEAWVLPEVARATLDALHAWQDVARAVHDRLERLGESATATELREKLAKAYRAVAEEGRAR